MVISLPVGLLINTVLLKMKALHPILKSLDRSIIRDFRDGKESLRVGPFEVIVSSELSGQYTKKISSFWEPIETHYIGHFISRYIDGFVALPDDSALFGFHPISPNLRLFQSFSDITPAGLCRYGLRRAIYLRQNALKVRRNIFTKGRIARRTTEFVLRGSIGRKIDSLYAVKAEQDGESDG